MDSIDKQIKRHTVSNQNYYCGTGWIAIPSGVDRQLFIQTALRTGRVTLLTSDGGFHNKVLCDKTILNQLVFPDNFNQKGSCVAWINIPVYNRIVIVSLLQTPSEGSIYEENEYEYGRTDGFASSTINGNGGVGRMLLSTTSIGTGSLIELNATNTQPTDINETPATSAIRLKVNGRIVENVRGSRESKITENTIVEIENPRVDALKTTIKADRESISFDIVDEAGTDNESTVVSLKYTKDEGLVYLDQYENEINSNETNIQIKAKEAVNIGEGTESMVLGDTLKTTLEDLITAIKAITVPTAMGPSGTPINFAQFDSINAQLSNILSTYSKTD